MRSAALMSLGFRLAVVASLGFSGAPAPSSAQADSADEQGAAPPQHDLEARHEPAEPAGYRAIVEEAVREYNARNFAEAHALFARAHAQSPNARTLRGLGMVEFELKRYQECIEHLQLALDSDVKSLDEQLRRKAEDLLTRARNFVASVRLEIEPLPVQVVVDGETETISKAAELLLRVGDHVLEFRAPGHYVERRELQLSGGEARTLRVVLTRQVNFAAAPLLLDEHKRSARRAWIWAGVAVLAAGTAVALTLALHDREKPYDGGTIQMVLGP
jgi:tetratricopeptide (TPR) repeat protein